MKFGDLGDETKVNITCFSKTAEICDTPVRVFNAIEGMQQTLQRLADQLTVATI